jgi:hypothetical protein
VPWFGRSRSREVPAPPTSEADRTRLADALDVDPGDSPGALRAGLADVVRFVNTSAGKLPAVSVVQARRLTDTLAEVIDTSEVRALDVYAVIAVRGTIEDYLPTTLRTYLAVDPGLLDTPRATGLTPRQSLHEQLEALRSSAAATLVAAREQDADALITQGSFLRTKFSGSDLDL